MIRSLRSRKTIKTTSQKDLPLGSSVWLAFPISLVFRSAAQKMPELAYWNLPNFGENNYRISTVFSKIGGLQPYSLRIARARHSFIAVVRSQRYTIEGSPRAEHSSVRYF